MNVTHPLGMLIFTHSLFLYPKPFLFSTVACNATPARSGVTYGILKLQYFTPFLRNVSLDRLWFYCAHSYDFCRIYSCINTTYFSRNISYTILFLYQRKGGFFFIFMATYIPSMITVLSQLASPADIIRGSSRP